MGAIGLEPQAESSQHLTDVNRAHDSAHLRDLTDCQFEAFVDYTAQNSQPLTTQIEEYHEALTC